MLSSFWLCRLLKRKFCFLEILEPRRDRREVFWFMSGWALKSERWSSLPMVTVNGKIRNRIQVSGLTTWRLFTKYKSLSTLYRKILTNIRSWGNGKKDQVIPEQLFRYLYWDDLLSEDNSGPIILLWVLVNIYLKKNSWTHYILCWWFLK